MTDTDIVKIGPLASVTKQFLIAYLKDRKLKCSGKKKELYELALCAEKLEISPVGKEPFNRSSNLSTPTGETLPEPTSLSGSGWLMDSGDFPSFGFKELYNYLVLRKSWVDGNMMQANKERTRAELFYSDGHVQDLRVHNISDTSAYCFVAAEVLPSVPTQDAKRKPPYKSWVSLSKLTSCVNSASCTCVSGKGESCNHIAAILYALKDITAKLEREEISCTSRACEWVQPRRRRQSPIKAGNVLERVLAQVETSPVKEEEIASFTVNLKSHFSRAGWLLNKISNEEQLPTFYIPFMFRDTVNLKDHYEFFKNFAQNTSMSAAEVKKTFIMTNGQSKNLHWKTARNGRITASNFGAVCKRRDQTDPEALLRKLFGYSREYHGQATVYGLEQEQHAAAAYCSNMHIHHPGLTVASSGLFIHEDYPYLGASPDGIVTCPHCGQEGLIEIKSPFLRKNLSPEQLCSDKTFYCSLVNGKLKLKKDHNYYFQIQGQMACSGKSWCDFCVWTQAGISTERVAFDPEFWAGEMLPKLHKFYIECVLPELFSHRLQRGRSLF